MPLIPFGALSVTVQDAGDEPLLEPTPGEMPVWTCTRVVALFDATLNVTELKQQLQLTLDAQLPGFLVETLEDRDWSTTWRDTFGAMQFGKHLWVCPLGEQPADPDAVVVHLDPGMAFGTGTHATTAMCLEWLDGHPPINQNVIDYGCGSGILAIAASMMGAASVTAVDIDPQALQATRENARRVGCEIEALLPETLGPSAADLVLANILANPLIGLTQELTSRVRPGGWLVMTGILAEQAEDVMAAYQDAFEFDTPCQREEWVLLQGRRHPA